MYVLFRIQFFLFVCVKNWFPFQDKYKRALADGENTRQRFNKQLEESKLYGIQSFCKDLLDIADTLSLANESVPKEEVKESNPHLKSLYEGLIMTDSNLKKVNEFPVVKVVNPWGKKKNLWLPLL